jgi:superfamily II DNA or RNA helicase
LTAIDRFLSTASSWEDFFSKASTLPARAPGSAPDKGKVFERLTQLYLKTYPEYQTRLKKVWRVEDELPLAIQSRIGLPLVDEGIDLIAETFDGDLWTIQCKFRTETHQPLTVTDLATFTNLSFNVCSGISLAVVAHTCAKPVRKATLLGRTTEIGLERWLELDEEDWRRILAATTKTPPPLKSRMPRPHQQRAVADAKAHFLDRGARRGRLIMPCGTGKSLTSFWIANELKARSILVAVPSLSLIKQSLTDWTREFLAHGEIPDWLCVCSDESTGRLERDEFVGGVYELGVDATTDIEEIGRFLAKKTGKRKIVFATYQSGKPLSTAARAVGFGFDLGIMDEAHRTVGLPDKSFGHLLLDKSIPITKRIFMTGTERIVCGADDTVFSMDNSTVYGECFHELSFKKAIETKPPIISDYRVLTITVSDDRVKKLIEENRYLRTAGPYLGEREAQALAAGIALQRAFRENGVHHAISFHRSIRAAEEFKEQQECIEAGTRRKNRPACYHISSKKTAGERADLLREFRKSPSALITNARCLQEGVDIPAVDCVLFADPKQSVVDIVQAAGRAMRPSKGKRYGYIVVPIVVPSSMDFAEFAETTDFKQVARVVTALSTQDDRIAEEFRGVTARNRRSRERIVEIVGDVPMAQFVDFESFREQVRLKFWERVGRVNWRSYEEARLWARSLGLKSRKKWVVFCKSGKLPKDIPAYPDQTYADHGWKGMGDWLGAETISLRHRHFRSYSEARSWSRSLGLKSWMEWVTFCKSGKVPTDIPSNPNKFYAGRGWKGIGDWLGTEVIAPWLRKFRSFSKARSWARSLGLKSMAEWVVFRKSSKMPKDIPAAPSRTYADHGWKGYGDWLGTGTVAPHLRKYRSFSKARSWARSLGLKSYMEWGTFCKSGKLPKDIPAHPKRKYVEKGWKGWGDWLGTR